MSILEKILSKLGLFKEEAPVKPPVRRRSPVAEDTDRPFAVRRREKPAQTEGFGLDSEMLTETVSYPDPEPDDQNGFEDPAMSSGSEEGDGFTKEDEAGDVPAPQERPAPKKPAKSFSRDLTVTHGGRNDVSLRNGGRRSVIGMRAETASEEDIAYLKTFTGVVLTASAIRIEGSARLQCAFLDSGWLVVNESDPSNPSIQYAERAVKKAGKQITRRVKVPMPVIALIYRNYQSLHEEQSASEVTSVNGFAVAEINRSVLMLIEKAFKEYNTTDIHITYIPNAPTQVEFRSLGELSVMGHEDEKWGDSFCRAVFAMSESSDSGYIPYLPQNARMSKKAKLCSGVEAIRCAFAPLPNGGRYLVMRILPEGNREETRGLSDFGYRAIHIRDFTSMRRQPEGVIVIAGPTGSGKTTTLCIAIATDRKEEPGRNIITIEDPPEYHVPGAKQLAVTNAHSQEERDKVYNLLLNIVMRLDPDTVMVSEIRDGSSGKAAIKLASSGHRVYTTTHANSGIGIIDRLRELDIPLHQLTNPNIFGGFIGQRLVRKLCGSCKINIEDATAEQLEAEGVDPDLKTQCLAILEQARKGTNPEKVKGVFIANHAGCPHCRRGISGRGVVAETIRPTYEFTQPLRSNDTAEAVRVWLENMNGLTMHEHALQFMVEGHVSPRDVINMTGDIMRFDMKRCERVFGDLMKNKGEK
mgnify:CR=1 FL=1